MSADNGVYILKTAGPVYRVGYVIAISNLDYFQKLQPGMLDIYLIAGWGKSSKYSNYSSALKEAIIVAADLPPLEYGISEIDITPHRFPGD